MSDDRIRQLMQFLEEDPKDNFSKYALALEMLKMSDLERGRKLLEELMTDRPDYLATYYQLGKSYELAGEREKALLIYEKGIEIASTSHDRHTLSELRSARQNLLFSDEE